MNGGDIDGVKIVATDNPGIRLGIQELDKSHAEFQKQADELFIAQRATIESIQTADQKMARLVQEIAAACVEQFSGSEQINSAVVQLDRVTQQNSSTSEQIAASSEELSSQAQSLQETISRFKIGSDVSPIRDRARNKPKNSRDGDPFDPSLSNDSLSCSKPAYSLPDRVTGHKRTSSSNLMAIDESEFQQF